LFFTQSQRDDIKMLLFPATDMAGRIEEKKMGLRSAFVAALLLFATGVSAQAEVRIVWDLGGKIGPYLNKYASLRQSGQKVVIDGPCVSACTLVVAVIPRDRICVTQRALLGFHAAWMPDSRGRPVQHREATKLLWSLYPPKVRDWIKRRGGLNGKTLVMRGHDLYALYRPCAGGAMARGAPKQQ
jgi:hypothetical protein